MKNKGLLFVSLLLPFFIYAGCGQKGMVSGADLITNISTANSYKLYADNQTNTQFVIIDVRKPEEYSGGHIPGSININLYDSDFRQKLDVLDKNKVYLVYCRAGSRSAKAAQIMSELKFKKIYNMEDGFDSWSGAGYPSVK
ncbi:MAG: rhodanese-like domain-containing protein [Brevinematales bacterium]|nr:rhodanese-like domain-containing protein [Brevinematales bacterium]